MEKELIVELDAHVSYPLTTTLTTFHFSSVYADLLDEELPAFLFVSNFVCSFESRECNVEFSLFSKIRVK